MTKVDDLTALGYDEECDGCGLGGFGAAGGEPLPPLEECEAALTAVASVQAPEPDLELALAEDALSAEEELAFASVERPDMPTLEGLVAVAERYPGLKITFSF